MVDEWICWEEVLERVHEGKDGEGGLIAADGGHERVPEEMAHEDVVDTGQRIADSAEGVAVGVGADPAEGADERGAVAVHGAAVAVDADPAEGAAVAVLGAAVAAVVEGVHDRVHVRVPEGVPEDAGVSGVGVVAWGGGDSFCLDCRRERRNSCMLQSWDLIEEIS